MRGEIVHLAREMCVSSMVVKMVPFSMRSSIAWLRKKVNQRTEQ